MELAVALSKYVGEDDPLSLITEFVTGYAKKGQLSTMEIEILPDLINLRIFSNVIYFTGRYAGVLDFANVRCLAFTCCISPE